MYDPEEELSGLISHIQSPNIENTVTIAKKLLSANWYTNSK